MIDIFKNKSIILNQKTPLKIISWTTILILNLTFILTFGNIYKFNKYINYNAYIEHNEINLLIPKDELNNINHNLIFNKNTYKFDIKEISKEEYYENNIYYKKVIINSNIEEKYLKENNILKFYFKQNKTTLINEIIKFFKKGLI